MVFMVASCYSIIERIWLPLPQYESHDMIVGTSWCILGCPRRLKGGTLSHCAKHSHAALLSIGISIDHHLPVKVWLQGERLNLVRLRLLIARTLTRGKAMRLSGNSTQIRKTSMRTWPPRQMSTWWRRNTPLKSLWKLWCLRCQWTNIVWGVRHHHMAVWPASQSTWRPTRTWLLRTWRRSWQRMRPFWALCCLDLFLDFLDRSKTDLISLRLRARRTHLCHRRWQAWVTTSNEPITSRVMTSPVHEAPRCFSMKLLFILHAFAWIRLPCKRSHHWSTWPLEMNPSGLVSRKGSGRISSGHQKSLMDVNQSCVKVET